MAEPRGLVRITDHPSRAELEEAIGNLRARCARLSDPLDIEATELTIDELLDAWQQAT